jgi:hypothetical protein
MDAHPAPGNRAGVSVRRAKRADLAPVFALIRQARGGALSAADIVAKATGYAYLIAETQGRMVGVAGMLAENSVMCVRDLHLSGAATRGMATAALLDSVEREAGGLACEAVIVQAPPSAPVVDAILRGRHYEQRAFEDMKAPWRELVREQFEPGAPLWVNNLREPQ